MAPELLYSHTLQLFNTQVESAYKVASGQHSPDVENIEILVKNGRGMSQSTAYFNVQG